LTTMRNKRKADWRAVAARVTGVLVILVGILLAAGLCNANPSDNPVPNIFKPESTPADWVFHLSAFVLAITGVIFCGRCQLARICRNKVPPAER